MVDRLVHDLCADPHAQAIMWQTLVAGIDRPAHAFGRAADALLELLQTLCQTTVVSPIVAFSVAQLVTQRHAATMQLVAARDTAQLQRQRFLELIWLEEPQKCTRYMSYA